MREDIHLQVDEESAEERAKSQSRRDRVLAHPDIAALLCRPPFSASNPLFWSGYIPPKYHQGKVNDSPVRKQLIRICEMVAEREASPTPVAPEIITAKTLQILHICLGEYGITEREDKLHYLTSAAGRRLAGPDGEASSKELTEEEGQRAIQILRSLILKEKEQANAPDNQPGDTPVVSEVVGERLAGGADGGWPENSRPDGDGFEPPY